MPPKTKECEYCVPFVGLQEIKMRRYLRSDKKVGLEVEYTMCLPVVTCVELLKPPRFRIPKRFKLVNPPSPTTTPSLDTALGGLQDPAADLALFGHEMTTGPINPRSGGEHFQIPAKAAAVGAGPDISVKLTPLVCCLGDRSMVGVGTRRQCCHEMQEALCACVRSKQWPLPWSLGCGKANGGYGPTPPARDTQYAHCCWESCFQITPEQIGAYATPPTSHVFGHLLSRGGDDDTPEQTLDKANDLRTFLMEQYIIPNFGQSLLDLVSACGYASGSGRGVFSPDPEDPGHSLMNWNEDCKCREGSPGNWSCP